VQKQKGERMNEAFIGLNLFFLSLAFIVFLFGLIVIFWIAYEIVNWVYSKIKLALAWHRYNYYYNEILKQIKLNEEIYCKYKIPKVRK
jgi:hypothetical protein